MATEIDSESCNMARHNVKENGLQDRINVLQVEEDDPLIPSDVYDFTLCNPPFYSSPLDIQTRRQGKEADNVTYFDHSASESVYPGGELAFITRMVNESLSRKQQVRWYTTLVGLKENVKKIKNLLRDHQVSCIQCVSSQISRTTRWIIAWSFHEEERKKRNLQSAFTLHLPSTDYWPQLRHILEDLHFDISQITDSSWEIKCRGQVWTRAARRGNLSDALSPFVFNLVLDDATVLITSNCDPDDFNSFCNHLKCRICI